MRKRSTHARRWRLAVALVGALVVTAATSERAPASSVPPAPTVAPTITASPASPTQSSTAAFTYTHPQAGVTFQCSLDSASFSSCPARGITYGGLRDGAHTFRVAARNGSSALGPVASRGWTVDTTAPTVTITAPSDGDTLDAAAWATLCDGTPGVCGTASDPTGVDEVRVAVLQLATGRYWNGTIFAASSPQYLRASATTSWRLALARPADGRYVAFARGRDRLGNQPTTWSTRTAFSVDTTPLATPLLTETPEEVTTATTATFRFTVTRAERSASANGEQRGNDEGGDVGTECSLDGATPRACTSPQRFRSLGLGRHCFDVRAVDRSGRHSDATTWCWWVIVDSGFPLSGDAVDTLYPGTSSPVDVRITNPFPFALKVLSVTVTVAPATTSAACSGTQNLQVTRRLAVQPTIPAGATKALSELGVPRSSWPQVTMPNLLTNQDACKLARFTLRYTGTATKA